LADAGHVVTGLDFDSAVISRLNRGEPPLHEPGLGALTQKGLAAGSLRFTEDAAGALEGADLLWVAYDTPVDEFDRADVDYVFDRVLGTLRHLGSKVLVLVSSQLPVGTTRLLEERAKDMAPAGTAFAYSPENLRLGNAIEAFTRPGRIVAGVREPASRALLAPLFAQFTNRVEWMSVESAEMTKHALNAFLATSVAFINEIAGLCEQTGADAHEVERGLKSEPRIGARAYLTPGGAFAGGTLARDVAYLTGIGVRKGAGTHLLRAVRESNDLHREWARRKVEKILGGLRGKTVAIWGLAYKPGTDSLRRSVALELCRWFADGGAAVRAHDPKVRSLPAEYGVRVSLHASPREALSGADALVVATEWPEFKSVTAEEVATLMDSAAVFDPGGFLAASIGDDPRIRYFKVGRP
jgi:UDPglucose 6-dehydrogenase